MPPAPAALAASEGGCPGLGLPRSDDLEAASQLVPERVRVRERPLLVGQKPVRPEAPLREASELVGQANRGGEGLAAGHEPVGEPVLSGNSAGVPYPFPDSG